MGKALLLLPKEKREWPGDCVRGWLNELFICKVFLCKHVSKKRIWSVFGVLLLYWFGRFALAKSCHDMWQVKKNRREFLSAFNWPHHFYISTSYWSLGILTMIDCLHVPLLSMRMRGWSYPGILLFERDTFFLWQGPIDVHPPKPKKKMMYR